jgi:alginate O-acetyltransferase complex protein AlgI
MVFSSLIFLFLFFPVVVTVYFLLPGLRARNAWLLLVSLLFYAWGEVGFILLLLVSTLANFALGKLPWRWR